MNDSENQKKGEKIVSFMNTGVMLLIVTAVVYLLFFAFNYGYNSYFGLPVYFSTMLPLRMISKTPTLFILLLLFYSFLIFAMPLRRRMKELLLSRKTILFLLILTLLVNIIWWHDAWFTIFCAFALPYYFYLFLIEKKIKGKIIMDQDVDLDAIISELKIRKSLHEQGFYVSDDWIDKITVQTDELQEGIKESKNMTRHYVEVLGGDSILAKGSITIIGLVIIVYLLFAVSFIAGKYGALNEDSFLFIDEQTTIIDIYESNYVSIQVDYNKDENKYVQTGTYALIPIDNPELRLQRKEGIKIDALK